MFQTVMGISPIVAIVDLYFGLESVADKNENIKGEKKFIKSIWDTFFWAMFDSFGFGILQDLCIIKPVH